MPGEGVPRQVPPWARRLADGLLVLGAAGVPLSTTGSQAAVIGLAALTLVAVLARWPVVRRTPIDGALAIFYAALAVSTLASGRPLEAEGWGRLWIVVGYFVVFWWLRDGAHATRLVRVLVAAALIVSVYGILQHFTGADWYRGLLGRERHVRPREVGSSGYAVVGFFRSYLTFAHVMLIPFAFAAALAFRGRVLGLVTAPAAAAAIVFSTARGAWLGALAAAVALAATMPGVRRLAFFTALATSAALAFAVAPDLRSHAAHMFDLGGENLGRVGIYRANFDIVRDHPVLGLGFGRYQLAAKPYYDAHAEADRRSHAHSNFLQMAAEAGLVGLAAFNLLFATALFRGWDAVARAPTVEERTTAMGAWAALVAFLVGGLTQYSFGDNEVALAMWFALAILMRVRESSAPPG